MKRLFAGLLFCLAASVQVPAQSTSVRLEGQVVCCADCWAEAQRGQVEFGTAENLLKAILFDGVRVHPTANYTRGRQQFGVIFERGRNPGASYSISF